MLFNYALISLALSAVAYTMPVGHQVGAAPAPDDAITTLTNAFAPGWLHVYFETSNDKLSSKIRKELQRIKGVPNGLNEALGCVAEKAKIASPDVFKDLVTNGVQSAYAQEFNDCLHITTKPGTNPNGSRLTDVDSTVSDVADSTDTPARTDGTNADPPVDFEDAPLKRRRN